MILTCPACNTQYVVKDGAIPPPGRQVRCASCRHSWHQEPEDQAVGEAPPAIPPQDPGGGEGLPEEARVDIPAAEVEAPAGDDPAMDHGAEPLSGSRDSQIEPTAEEGRVATDEADYAPAPPAPASDDDFSPFAAPDEEEPERRSPLLKIAAAILLIAALGAAFWFLAPAEWKQRLGLATGSATPLQLMMTHSDRQRLASGNELLAISGRVINPTEERQAVPPITAQLRNGAGELVHSWTIAPPAPSLAPGASASFNSAEVNVPAGGDELTVTLGAPPA